MDPQGKGQRVRGEGGFAEQVFQHRAGVDWREAFEFVAGHLILLVF